MIVVFTLIVLNRVCEWAVVNGEWAMGNGELFHHSLFTK